MDFSFERYRWQKQGRFLYEQIGHEYKQYQQVGTKNYYKYKGNIPFQEHHGEYVTVTNTSRGNLQVLEVLNIPNSAETTQVTQVINVDGMELEIASDSLIGCVDASVKENMYGAHLCFKDTTDTFTHEYSIGSNQWQETPYYGEARILLEAYRVLGKLPYNRPYGSIKMLSDNKKLCNVLNKRHLTPTDVTQDAGVLIKEMDDIRKKVTFKITLEHISMEKELVSYVEDPHMFLIQRCHMESKNERSRMERNEQETSLPDTDVTINKSVHTFVRSLDEEMNGASMIEEKFGEFAKFIDYEARRVFKHTTPSTIKCCYGFNHHGVRNKMINKYSTDKCISCGETEDWTHILRCPSTVELREKWRNKLIKDIKHNEKNQSIHNDAFQFVEDIFLYMNGSNDVPGSQNVIGFKMLFRGYVVKDWFGGNSEETKYHNTNRMIVKSCVKLYHDCWCQRNDLMQNDKNKKDRLLEEVQRILEEYKNLDRVGVQSYLRQCPSNMSVRDTKYIENWITGFNLIKRSSEKYCPGDIRAYVQKLNSNCALKITNSTVNE